MTDRNPFTAVTTLAPVPATRGQATRDAWIRHYAALAFAAFTEFRNTSLAGFGRAGARHDCNYLIGMGIAAMAAAHALTDPGQPGALWDLTPESGAFNGEWEDWLADVLDERGINPADIDPAYNAGDFRSPTRAALAVEA